MNKKLGISEEVGAKVRRLMSKSRKLVYLIIIVLILGLGIGTGFVIAVETKTVSNLNNEKGVLETKVENGDQKINKNDVLLAAEELIKDYSGDAIQRYEGRKRKLPDAIQRYEGIKKETLDTIKRRADASRSRMMQSIGEGKFNEALQYKRKGKVGELSLTLKGIQKKILTKQMENID